MPLPRPNQECNREKTKKAIDGTETNIMIVCSPFPLPHKFLSSEYGFLSRRYLTMSISQSIYKRKHVKRIGQDSAKQARFLRCLEFTKALSVKSETAV